MPTTESTSVGDVLANNATNGTGVGDVLANSGGRVGRVLAAKHRVLAANTIAASLLATQQRALGARHRTEKRLLGPHLVGIPANRLPAFLRQQGGRRFSHWQHQADAERSRRNHIGRT